DGVADRLRHLSPLTVDDEPARQHRLVGWGTARRDRLQQRGVEPAAMLVRALEVELRRPPELRSRLEHRRVAAARVEPDVERVGPLAEGGAAAPAAAGARREQLRVAPQVPLLDPTARAEEPRHVLDDGLLEQERLAAGAVERHD